MTTSLTPTRKRRRRIPQEHYDAVSTMLISMVPYSMIIQQLHMKWSKPKKYVTDIIKQVHTDWAETAALVADTRRHQIRNGFEKMLMMATAAKDLPTMVRIQIELGKLDGCYVPHQAVITHQGAVGVGVGIALGGLGFKDPDEVRSRIDELQKKLAAQGPQALQAPDLSDQATDHLAGQDPLPINPDTIIDIEDENAS